MTREQIVSKMYALGCDFNAYSSTTTSSLSVGGLSENMTEAVKIAEDLIFNAVGNDEILARLKADELKSRANQKRVQRSNFSALQSYLDYGPEYIKKKTLTNAQLASLTSDELLAKVREVYSCGHEITYYGPMKEAEFKTAIADCHQINPDAVAYPEKYIESVVTPANEVVLAQYDAKQLYYYQFSCKDEKFNPDTETANRLYNMYFGGGMNGIVFQEMREARGLAYSAGARYQSPSYADGRYEFYANIATQNDKLQIAVEAFDDIINNMPQSEAAFAVAKESSYQECGFF